MNKVMEFIAGAQAELKKVSWPTRKELIDSTKVVIVSSLLLVVFIGLLDYVFSLLINLVF